MVKLRRVSVVERYIFESKDLILEAKKDLDDLKSHLGDDLFDDYMEIRDKIPSPSVLRKSYPEYSNTDILDENKEKEFVRKYNNLRKNILVLHNQKFANYPESINVNGINNEILFDYSGMRDYVLSTFDTYRDFNKLKMQPRKDIEKFVGNYTSLSDKRKSDKEGAKKLYEDSDWVVYRITAYPAAQYYGKNTKWCITGRYPGNEGRGEEYFNDYIKKNNLDGGYYFYISKKNPNEKYCVLQTKDRKIHSIWDASDTNRGSSVSSADVDLPEIKEVNLKKLNNEELLIKYCKDGNVEKVRELLDIGVSVKNKAGKTPLYIACVYGNLEIVRLLLDAGADVNVKDSFGDTSLYTACARGYFDIVKLLLKAGADVNVENRYGDTPLKMARTPEIKKLLIEYGAKE